MEMRIKFSHIRKHNEQGNILPNGGTTIAYCIDENHQVHGFAKSKCHEKDHFCKHTGRVKAKGRLKSAKYYQDISPAIGEDEFLSAMFASN